jgi:tRNA G18 (ribose-2'-O)-methylase SpoU
MAVGKVPAEPSLSSLLHHSVHTILFVALDGLMNAENVGVVVRNCAAFGVDAVIAGETSSSPYLRRAVRNSMGTVFQLPVIHRRDLAGSLRELHDLEVTIVGTDLKGNVPIHEADFKRNICLIFGNEERGVSEPVLRQCDLRVCIPMMNRTDSLNVSSASAAFLYEASRQRGEDSTW